MNILILSWRGPGHPQAGGAEQATWHHALGWTRAGHHVTLFTSAYTGCIGQEIDSGISIIRRGDQYIGVKIAAFFWYLLGSHPVFNLVVDEFHGLPFFTPLYIRTKKLAFIHETGTRVWALNFWPFPFNLIPAVLGPIIEPLIFKLFYRPLPFMTVSRSTSLDLQKFGIKNITVISNGVTLPDPLPKVSRDKEFTLIYLSTLAKDKGTEDAIRTYDIIKPRLPDSQFWIVGSGAPNYLAYLRSLSASPQYFGFVSEADKFSLLSRAHVLIFPSAHEGWGLVVIEANAMGLPVVAYDVPGSRDSVKDNQTGILCPSGDINSLAASVLRLHDDPRMYSQFSRQARIWAAGFSWQKSIDQSLNLISSL